MGMYTELNIGVEFKKDIPSYIIQTIEYMTQDHIDQGKFKGDFPLEHALFKTDRWHWMLKSGGSYYFDTQPMLHWAFDTGSKTWKLSFVTNIKNYTHEWEEFLKFIAPHLRSEGYIGTYRYEEASWPTLLFVIGSEI